MQHISALSVLSMWWIKKSMQTELSQIDYELLRFKLIKAKNKSNKIKTMRDKAKQIEQSREY